MHRMESHNPASKPEADDTLTRTKLGEVWVDSGQLYLGDPLYLEEFDPETLQQATTMEDRQKLLNEGMAAVFRSGLRNTKIPVYITRYPNGAISRVEIVFDER